MNSERAPIDGTKYTQIKIKQKNQKKSSILHFKSCIYVSLSALDVIILHPCRRISVSLFCLCTTLGECKPKPFAETYKLRERETEGERKKEKKTHRHTHIDSRPWQL